MREDIENLKIEYKELKEKYKNFIEIFGSPKFNLLLYEQKHWIRKQAEVMEEYLKILKKRIRLETQLENEENYI